MSDPADLTDLAAAVADGSSIDWEAAESSARTEDDRDRVRRLRVLARIAAVYGGDPITHAPGTRWGGLQIAELIGRGTFGDVYRARDPRLDRDVALKLLRQPERPTATNTDTFTDVIAEGRLLGRVRHPNIVAVFGADRIDGRVGVWMELVEGRTLEDESRERGPLSPEEVAQIGVEVCRALGAVHAAGLLHRDVKAQNVMREARAGRIVLMDFSAGRELGERETENATMPVSVVGSP